MNGLYIEDIKNLSPKSDVFQTYTVISERIGDVYFDIEYLSANDLAHEGDTKILLYTNNEGSVAYPFVVNEIPSSITCGLNDKRYFDIITPYEYGGPVIQTTNGSKSRLIKSFIGQFTEFCLDTNIITESIRFNPLLKNHSDWEKIYQINRVNDNLIIDLNESEEVIFSKYHKNKRRDIKSAINKQIQIKDCYDEKDLVHFMLIYSETMHRRNANQFYYFSNVYFKALFNLIKKDLASLYIAYSNSGEPLSASFFLHKSSTVHYHLSGSLRAQGETGAQSYLLHRAILDMKQRGFHYFHFGGAAKNQQGLYKFKSMFTPFKISYHFGSRVISNEVYLKLKANFIKSHPLEKELSTDTLNFFPLYRMKL